ncbi:MAG: PAS domain S-box protein [Polyangia bacterium]|nr:PAS domain S-box protein [Polyangia bacterium]
MNLRPLIALIDSKESSDLGLLVKAIEELGHDVLAVQDCAALREQASSLGVILLANGDRAAWQAEKLASHPGLAELPIVALLVGTDREPSFAPDGVLQLPCSPELLRLTLERYLAEGASRRARARTSELLSGIASAAEHLGDPAELERNLDSFVQSVCGLLRARDGALLLFGKAEREIWLVASQEGNGGSPVPLEEGAALALQSRIGSGGTAIFDDPEGDGLLASCLGRESPGAFPRSMTLSVPIQGRPAGGLLLALPDDCPLDAGDLRNLGTLLASLLGGALQGSMLWKRLREQTKPIHLDRLESELRNRTLRRYREFFESSSDGVIVVDAQGRVAHINRSGAMMTGYAEGWLLGRPLTDIVESSHREGLDDIIRQGNSGTPLANFDLRLATTSDDVITVDVSASSLMLDQRVMVLTFRDVSEARSIEDELTKTKEFLERLIDSAVDAIVAADAATGTIILFNEGAANLFGRPTEQVVGRLNLTELFPEEDYEDFIRQLHSQQFGGEGRLEKTHLHARDSMGQHVPVTLTASTIHEEEREVAIVAILTDMREQIQIQERLAITEEKLEVTEKQALIAELAGTTAHELNQPLTSVMGYAELLVRKAGEDSPLAASLKVILQEAGRMAEIVRKIGQITRYETKSYVGSTQILDLDRATEQ